MTRAFWALALASALSSTAAAQVFAGDSLRVRDGREMTWRYGRLLSQDATVFSLGRATDTLRVPIIDLRRVERWQRNDRNLVWAIASVGMLAATLGYYLTPEEEKRTGGGCVITIRSSGSSSVCTTITTKTRPGNLRTMQALGAAGGAAMGFVGIAIWPGQWKVVLNR